MSTTHLLLFFNLVALLWLLSCCRSAAADSLGTLYFQVVCYHHPSQKTHGGVKCDPHTDCDPYFTFCFSNVYRKREMCDLKRFTFNFTNQRYLGVCNKHDPTNFPRVMSFGISMATVPLYLRLVIMDVDKFFMESLIDDLTFQVLPGLPTLSNAQPFNEAMLRPLNISSRVFTHHDQPRIELKAAFRCAQFRYGPMCSVECRPSSKYVCLDDGSRKCNSGWRGSTCDVRDYCSSSPCRKRAVCHNTVTSFTCECDGRTGPQCELNGDPCFDNLCANGASCVGSDGHPKCVCAKGWIGRMCEEKDSCAFSKCGKHGICVKVDEEVLLEDGRTISYICNCESGYNGRLCQNFIPLPTTSTSTVNHTNTSSSLLNTRLPRIVESNDNVNVTLTVILCLMIFGCFTTGLFLLYRRHKKHQKRRQFISESIGRVSYNVNSSIYDDAESLYEDPDMNNPVYLYEEANEPYSLSTEGTMSAPSSAFPFQASTSSSRGPRSPIRFIRA